MAIPGSKKTYTINIKYTTKYPHEIDQQNNAKYKPANFEMSNNSFSSPTSSSQTYSGKMITNMNNVISRLLKITHLVQVVDYLTNNLSLRCIDDNLY